MSWNEIAGSLSEEATALETAIEEGRTRSGEHSDRVDRALEEAVGDETLEQITSSIDFRTVRFRSHGRELVGNGGQNL